MKKYDVYKVEEMTTKTGKALKKLVLQGEGDQYPMKNVTMWANHPLFEEIAPGQQVDLEIEVKDSATPNPHGGFFKNRTVIDPNFTPKSAPKNTDTPHEEVTNAKIFNLLNLKILPEIQALKDRLDVFIDEENIQPKFSGKRQTGVEYPEYDPKDHINPEDMPF